MTNPTGDRDVLDGLTTLSPSADLRARTLVAARQAAVLEQPIPRWRALPALFSSQPGWTSAFVALLVAHIALGYFLEGRHRPRVTSPRAEEVAAQPDLLRLPLIDGPVHDVPGDGDHS